MYSCRLSDFVAGQADGITARTVEIMHVCRQVPNISKLFLRLLFIRVMVSLIGFCEEGAIYGEE